jgi:signal transduction histidine kinase
VSPSSPPPAGTERWQRLLLSGGLLDRSGGPRTPRDWAVDAGVCAVTAGCGAYVLASTWDQRSSGVAALDIVLGVVALLALWWRRERPVAVAVLVLALSAVSALASIAPLAAVFNAAIRAPWRRLAAVAALSVPATVAFALLYPDGPDGRGAGWQVAVGLMLTAIAVGWGLFVRAQRELVWSLHDRAQRAEAEERERVARAREAERRRIAGEMHDVLAHRLSLLALHAGALEFRGGELPGELAEAAGVVRTGAHAALQELSAVIGVLREGDDALVPPQPTLAQVPALVAESRIARLPVTCRMDVPDGRAVPAAVERAAYRVVQEGLTNARKHAPPGSRVELTIAAAAGPRLLVDLVSRPPADVDGTAPDGPMPGAGSGLIGLAERVALAGGRLEHGPAADGAFVLRAMLPWTP